MKKEHWRVGSHRGVDRQVDGRWIEICEIYSGAADSLEQADRIQRLIAAVPELLLVVEQFFELCDNEVQNRRAWQKLFVRAEKALYKTLPPHPLTEEFGRK